MAPNSNKREQRHAEDIPIEALRILNAVKPPSSGNLAEESKEFVYKALCKRINRWESGQNPIRVKLRQVLPFLLPVASALALLVIPLSFISYNRGYETARLKLADAVIEFTVPRGGVSTITLADCTKVVLNGGSTLIYPACFGKERTVTLSGEAFFDVSKSKKQPFVVHARNLTAKVLGTQFNFRAYDDDNTTILTLAEGSLFATPPNGSEEEGLYLKPSQQIIVDNTTNEMTRRNVDAEVFISWKNGILTFRDSPLGEIVILLEKHFNVSIRITTESLKSERYSAQFKHGETIYQLLDKLSHKRSWGYELMNGQLIISRTGQQKQTPMESLPSN